VRDLSIALGLGFLAAGIGARSGLPGAAVVLPIITVAAWNLLFVRQLLPPPSWLQLAAFGFLGTSIGLSVSRSSLQALQANWPVLLLMAVSVYVTASLVMILIAHFSRIDIATAVLAGSPGGLVGISAVSLSAGANVAVVVATQTLRILIIFLSLPFLLALLRRFR
jgi:uncharacterized protein